MARDATHHEHLLRALEVQASQAVGLLRHRARGHGSLALLCSSTRCTRSNTFDYGVQEFLSERVDEKHFRTSVVVRRYGEATFPVDVVTTFENGERTRETWNGQEQRAIYVYEKPVRGTTAQVEPDHVLLLDVAYTNNSRTLEPSSGRASLKWSLKWMVWLRNLDADVWVLCLTHSTLGSGLWELGIGSWELTARSSWRDGWKRVLAAPALVAGVFALSISCWRCRSSSLCAGCSRRTWAAVPRPSRRRQEITTTGKRSSPRRPPGWGRRSRRASSASRRCWTISAACSTRVHAYAPLRFYGARTVSGGMGVPLRRHSRSVRATADNPRTRLLCGVRRLRRPLRAARCHRWSHLLVALRCVSSVAVRHAVRQPHARHEHRARGLPACARSSTSSSVAPCSQSISSSISPRITDRCGGSTQRDRRNGCCRAVNSHSPACGSGAVCVEQPDVPGADRGVGAHCPWRGGRRSVDVGRLCRRSALHRRASAAESAVHHLPDRALPGEPRAGVLRICAGNRVARILPPRKQSIRHHDRRSRGHLVHSVVG